MSASPKSGKQLIDRPWYGLGTRVAYCALAFKAGVHSKPPEHSGGTMKESSSARYLGSFISFS